jgi:TolA-binding protein
MRRRWAVCAAVLSLAAGSVSQAAVFDTIKTIKTGLPGRVTGVTAVKVEYEQAGAAALLKEVPVNEILTIYYGDDPKELTTAKRQVLEGHYAEALAAVGRVKGEPGRAEVRQDLEFYKALCTAKLALAGNGKIDDAGRMMKAFADAYPNNYHYFEATELVGDLLLAFRQYPQAAEYYGRLAKAPWPDYQMRASVAAGRVLLAQGRIDEALAAFEKVITNTSGGELAQTQRLLATLEKASALVALQKPDEAILLAEGVLKSTDPKDEPLRAQAYNIEGKAHRQAGRAQEALFAFLHVEFFYSSVPSAHAEALANLADLWEQLHKAERANNARKMLEERYKDSPWNKKAGQQP